MIKKNHVRVSNKSLFQVESLFSHSLVIRLNAARALAVAHLFGWTSGAQHSVVLLQRAYKDLAAALPIHM